MSGANPISMAEAGRRMRGLGVRLTDLLAGSEEAFTETGGRLQQLIQRSGELVGASTQGMALSIGGGLSPGQSLSHALRMMEQHLAASEAAAAAGVLQLSAVLKQTDDVISIGAEFQWIALKLKALATSFHIEGGRNRGEEGFDSVAIEVARLGEQISLKFRAILARARALQETAKSAHTRERQFVVSHGDVATSLMAEARANLTALQALDESTTAIRVKASSTADELSRAASRVLVALQAHDSTRQMIEHVVAALAESSSAEETDDLSSLCRVQAGQVRAARDVLSQAHQSISESLCGMASEVGAVVDRASGQAEDRELLGSVERGVEQIASTLRAQLEHERTTFAAIASVVEAGGKIEGFLGEIAAIARDAKIVALNALVKAVRVGASAAAFAILAQAVKDVSVEVTNNSGQVGQSMRQMASTARALAQESRNSRLLEATEIESQLSQLVQALRGHHRGLSGSLEYLRRGSVRVGADVERLVALFSRQTVTIDALRLIEEELSELADQIADDNPPSSSEEATRRLAAAAARYTMESERRIHEDLFGSDPGTAGAPAAGSTNTVIDDNVEFF